MKNAPANRLTVAITARSELDMGTLRASPEAQTIKPPEVSLYDQVVGFLDALPPAPPWKPRDRHRFAGAATALVCVRWSSWLALLAHPGRPLWAHAGDPDVGAIADSEMARINIEASSGLERWVDLFRSDRDRWDLLAAKALVHLPRSGRIPNAARGSPLKLVAHPGVPALIAGWPEEDRARRLGASPRTGRACSPTRPSLSATGTGPSRGSTGGETRAAR